MHVVPQQVINFLATSAPFDKLKPEQLTALAKSGSVLYLTAQNAPVLIRDNLHSLFLIQSGQFSLQEPDGSLSHLSDGDYFGLLVGKQNTFNPEFLSVSHPGLVYVISSDTFSQNLLNLPELQTFFNAYKEQTLHSQAIDDSNSIWLHKPLAEVLSDKLVSARQDTPILLAVQLMAQQQVSTLLITDFIDDEEQLVGIMTDRDIRNRVVAAGVDMAEPVSVVMTPKPCYIEKQHTLFDALCLMSEKNIHHLPIVESNKLLPIGLITATDMLRYQRANVLFIIGELMKAQSLYELTRLSWQLPQYFSTHAKRLGDFDVAGKILSQSTDIMTRKLIEFFQLKNGVPPFDYCWLVYGSQAREDQTMGSDQDNGLLLARIPDKQQAQYFADMSDYVCKGLNKCGIASCTGNIMASNPELRQSVEQAITEAHTWVDSPTPKALLSFNIFLDVRPVAGNINLFKQLHQARSPLFNQSRFLALLARQVGDLSVPLSMFKRFTYDKGTADAINLKKYALNILNSLVRIYALSAQLSMPSTLSRLANLPSEGGLTKPDADNLRDIWLFLNRLRWRHQVSNKVTDNSILIKDLSAIEKHQLKAAFKAIQIAQQGALMKFCGELS
jgi:CBS domain-containing protein